MGLKEDGKDLAKNYAATKAALANTERQLTAMQYAQEEAIELQKEQLRATEERAASENTNQKILRVTTLMTTKAGQKELKKEYSNKIKYWETRINSKKKEVYVSYYDLTDLCYNWDNKYKDFVLYDSEDVLDKFVKDNKELIEKLYLLKEIRQEVYEFSCINDNSIWNLTKKKIEKYFKDMEPLTKKLDSILLKQLPEWDMLLLKLESESKLKKFEEEKNRNRFFLFLVGLFLIPYYKFMQAGGAGVAGDIVIVLCIIGMFIFYQVKLVYRE